jgi:hypothetical protein
VPGCAHERTHTRTHARAWLGVHNERSSQRRTASHTHAHTHTHTPAPGVPAPAAWRAAQSSPTTRTSCGLCGVRGSRRMVMHGEGGGAIVSAGTQQSHGQQHTLRAVKHPPWKLDSSSGRPQNACVAPVSMRHTCPSGVVVLVRRLPRGWPVVAAAGVLFVGCCCCCCAATALSSSRHSSAGIASARAIMLRWGRHKRKRGFYRCAFDATHRLRVWANKPHNGRFCDAIAACTSPVHVPGNKVAT